jgi:hypothetical protein
MYVLLQAPNDGYYIVVQATSKKHFSLVDAGWVEINSGQFGDMIEEMAFHEAMSGVDLIQLYCHDTFSLIQTSHECLEMILENDPDYLEDKEFL